MEAKFLCQYWFWHGREQWKQHQKVVTLWCWSFEEMFGGKQRGLCEMPGTDWSFQVVMFSEKACIPSVLLVTLVFHKVIDFHHLIFGGRVLFWMAFHVWCLHAGNSSMAGVIMLNDFQIMLSPWKILLIKFFFLLLVVTEVLHRT